MSPGPDGTPQNTVEELVDVENKIEKLRREVSRKERQEWLHICMKNERW